MGMLVDGKWKVQSVVTSDKDGSYERIPRSFLETISHDHPTFKPESNRYHLYVSYATWNEIHALHCIFLEFHVALMYT